MYEFLSCLHCDSLRQGKGRANEKEMRDTFKCLFFQSFVLFCFSHGLFSTLDPPFLFNNLSLLVCL